MNKKFSTLMASVLLASAFGTASADNLNPKPAKNGVKEGNVVALFTVNDATKVLSLNAETKVLGTATAADVYKETYAADAFKNVRASLWKVASLKYDQITGVGIYQFVNKATGEYLAINLTTDKNGVSEAATKTTGAGNKNWCLAEDGTLYSVANDSIYTLNATDLKLQAKKGGVDKLDGWSNTAKLFVASLETAKNTNGNIKPDMKLTYEGFNELMELQGHDGKLHFNNSKNVSDGQSNVLTGKKWKAYLAGLSTSNKFFLADADASTEVNKNPYLLMVDKDQYAPAMNNFFKLVTDTLSIDKTTAASLVANGLDEENKVNHLDLIEAGTNANAANAGAYNHPVRTATWSAVYHFTKDSLVLSVAGIPTEINTGDFALTDGTNAWSDFGTSSDAANDLKSLVPVYKNLPEASSLNDAVKNLKAAVETWIGKAKANDAAEAGGLDFEFAKTRFKNDGSEIGATDNTHYAADDAEHGVLTLAQKAEGLSDAQKAFVAAVATLERKTVAAADAAYFIKGMPSKPATTTNAHKPMIAELMGTKVLTVASIALDPDYNNYVKPLVQPFATEGGDAVITTGAKLYRIQIANTTKDMGLRATADNSKYLVATGLTSAPYTTLVESVDDANVYAQWAFIQGTSGYYQVINRGSEYQLYAGPVSKVKDAAGKVVADTYVFGTDTVKLAGVTLSTNEFEDKEGDKTVKYDYSGYFYAGPTKDKSYTFAISPAAPIMVDLGAQFNKDSVMVLGKADQAPVWYFEEAGAVKYGLEIEGLTPLKYMTYRIFTKDANGDSLYVSKNGTKYSVTNKGRAYSTFALREMNKGQYLFLDGADSKMTINPSATDPVLEVTKHSENMRDDYFVIASASWRNRQTLWGGCTDANPKLLLNDT